MDFKKFGHKILFLPLISPEIEDILESIQEKTYDVCLTSPPYFDLEVYSHEETQSINNYKTYGTKKIFSLA